jgi:hypothetical protein
VVLRVVDVFHPVDDLAVEPFRDRDVRHRCGRRRAVPVFLTRREPDDIARSDLLDRPALALRKAAAGRHDQCLPEGMRVPGRALLMQATYIDYNPVRRSRIVAHDDSRVGLGCRASPWKENNR